MSSLPIHSALPKLCKALNTRDEVVLEAPPGAGKTTHVPLALMDEAWLDGQKILMLEPRRLAARAAAEYMASQLGEKTGETVGYRVRLETRVGMNTRIEIVTEGILTRMLQNDPSLEAYGLVIFDEFHERNLDADLGLALTLESRLVFRDEVPLKLLIMSATLDGARISSMLDNAPVICSEGRSFPVRQIYCGMPAQHEWIETKTTNVILQALAEQSGSILCFLPGMKEIRQVHQLLSEQLTPHESSQIILAPLFGNLTLTEQKQAIETAPEGQRKIVLATNIAETSLTIEGITVVVDAGLSRESRYDPNTAMSRLHTRKVSVAEATQRSGRAGRLSEGVSYRLWSESQHNQLNPYATAEILNADLTPMVLQLACWGVDDPATLCWLDLPPKGAYQQARELLLQLGAIASTDQITAHGQLMAELPAHPRISHMLIKASQLGLLEKGCLIAALLTERDPFHDQGGAIQARIDWLNETPRSHKSLWKRIHKQAASYKKQCRALPLESNTNGYEIDELCQAGLLLAFAFPDRIARQRTHKSPLYHLNNGRAATLSDHDKLSQHSWLVLATLQGSVTQANDRITLASHFSPELATSYLPELLTETEVVDWREKEGRIIAEKHRMIGSLVWEKQRLENPSEERVTRALLQAITQRGLNLLPWTDELRHWQDRVIFLHRSAKEAGVDEQWPDISDRWLIENLDNWLAPFLGSIRTINQLKQLDLKSALHTLLPWPLPQQLDERAPKRYNAPSGSNISIDYSSYPPVLAIKLQEMFGCCSTPVVGYNTAFQIHLLSPARRPLQVTQDLESFWTNGYRDVQKEMKGRYPKHPWPDNPLAALPTAKVKKRL
ncbi:ATP-dependent helicase HrpB [uncultured Neptuniibacter sp.]|uniref:ATP-dependent helicase HrpB n=1 Tax=uncultured Neptuniibacter sp. TaxID=502143 RepID=UPI00260488C1|nr:ATP-dependent helicase HrpB [uncultured Neptuniibacter sp.]